MDHQIQSFSCLESVGFTCIYDVFILAYTVLKHGKLGQTSYANTCINTLLEPSTEFGPPIYGIVVSSYINFHRSGVIIPKSSLSLAHLRENVILTEGEI